MDGRRPLNEDIEGEAESSDEDLPWFYKVDSVSTSSSDEDVDVAFLLVDETPSESSLFAVEEDKNADSQGPFEVIEELM